MTNLLGNTTLEQIASKLNVYQFLVISTNYLQFTDINLNFIEIQFCYKEKKWYQFKSFGNSKNPKEIFVKYI
jgi:hypothetical protein